MRRAPRMFRVTADIRLRAPSPFGAPSRRSPGFTPGSASGCACEHLQQLALLQRPSSELLAPRSLCRRGRVRSRPGAVCETARRRRSSLHLQDRIRNVPFDERACFPLKPTCNDCQELSHIQRYNIDFMKLSAIMPVSEKVPICTFFAQTRIKKPEVARMERSAIRDRRCSVSGVPRILLRSIRATRSAYLTLTSSSSLLRRRARARL